MATNLKAGGRPTLYLVDGHSHLYKAFYAVRSLSTSKGLPTNAIYGFVQILHRLIDSRQPDYLAVVFDPPGPTFRSEIYKEYKANRPAQPEDLSVQIPWLKRVLEEMRIPVLEQARYEADDVIGTLATQGSAEGLDVWLVSSDKDLFQLVGPGIGVLRMEPSRDIELDVEGVREKLGVPPEQVTDLLGLMGDSSDNIPGVPKVGEKTAVKLLAEFPSIEAIYDDLQSVSNARFQRLLEGHRDQATLSKRLATICRDVPVDVKIDNLKRREPNLEGLIALYRELEFRNLLQRLAARGGAEAAQTEAGRATAAAPKPATGKTVYRAIVDEERLRDFVGRIRKDHWLAVDTETSEVDPMRADLVGISLSLEPNAAVYIPIGHRLLVSDQLPLDRVREILGPALADPEIPKTGQNLKYDMKILMRHGMALEGIAFDTLLASYLLEPDRPGHGLKAQGRERLGIEMLSIEELIGRGKQQMSMADVEIERVTPYACADADVTLQLTVLLARDLETSGLANLLKEIELPLTSILNRMEMTGVRIDPDILGAVSQELASRMEGVAREIYKLAGKSFNIGSPKQVGEMLFVDMGLKPIRQTKTGPSTDVSVLEELSRQGHELPRRILDYRTLGKLKSTYADTLPGMVNPATGRIHTSYNQAIAATGRLSSSDPNLQNIPVRTPEGRQIRRGFIPLTDDHGLLAADYSQIELRVLAHVTEDPSLIEAFQNDLDIHRLTASKVFGCKPDDVTSEMRGSAKVVNFGIIYGMSAHRLAAQLEISRTEAGRFIDDYFQAYPRVKEWTNRIVESARENGYVSTLSGRRRTVANIDSRNHNLRTAAERVAINTPIQGTAADLMKMAMIAVDRRLAMMDTGAKMIMQVHDELIFSVPHSEVDVVRHAVCEEMERAMELAVPLKVDFKVGRNWEEC